MDPENKMIESYKETIIKMVYESKDFKILKMIHTFIVHVRPKEV
jgi:hypothetical protein